MTTQVIGRDVASGSIVSGLRTPRQLQSGSLVVLLTVHLGRLQEVISRAEKMLERTNCRAWRTRLTPNS
jgi:hypothetical protein